ncbi:MAG TPA: HlyD family efflux transporter periplasmic adaptor subunit [Longimicrobiales bacterium]
MNRRRAAVPVVLTLIGLGAWLAFRPSGDDAGVLEASGTVEATEADLGFQAGGRIAEVLVREGDRVEAGALLARLDDAELVARLAAAEAQLEVARQALRELERGARPEELRQAEAAEAAARQRMEEAQRLAARTRTLYEGGAVSAEELERAETAHEVAAAQHRQAAEQLALVRSGARPERVDAQRAAVRQAEAAVAQAEAMLANARIHAPFSGIVTVRHRHPGEAVSPGAPVLTLMDPADRWVRIYVREDRVGRVSLGQRAEIRADAYPDRRYDGRVVFIAGEAEFTPRNVQTAEERVKLVYAVKVAIEGDSALELKPGLPADVRLLPADASDARSEASTPSLGGAQNVARPLGQEARAAPGAPSSAPATRR